MSSYNLVKTKFQNVLRALRGEQPVTSSCHECPR